MKQETTQYPLRIKKELLDVFRREAESLDISLNAYLKIKLLTTANILQDNRAVVTPLNEDEKQ